MPITNYLSFLEKDATRHVPSLHRRGTAVPTFRFPPKENTRAAQILASLQHAIAYMVQLSSHETGSFFNYCIF